MAIASGTTTLTEIVCSGCGYNPPATETRPFRCRNAERAASSEQRAGGAQIDHVLKVLVDTERGGRDLRRAFSDPERDPFVRYRRFMHSWNAAMASGMSDGEYVDLVRRFEEKIAAVDGHGFAVTPLERQPELERALGVQARLFVKNETGNVSGSHKGRHLFGLMLWMLVMERADPQMGTARLAIASCGNAALAAAVVARAAGRALDVFVPTDANPSVVARLKELGATVTTCPRRPNELGDPSYLRFKDAVAAGALPFTCQGNENGLVIEGCRTLGLEIVSQLIAENAALDRIFIQVGGGALASAVIAALEDAAALGAIARLPRIHAVQTASAFPLRRAYDRVVARISGGSAGDLEDLAANAAAIAPADAEKAMRFATSHRAEFMWPWESVPQSVAHGILDDETYDWAAVVRGMLISGGYPIVVSEEQLKRANSLAVEATGIPVDHTGSSGLAGVVALREVGVIDSGESIAVLFTGRKR